MTVILDANILISAILSPKGTLSEILRTKSYLIDFAAPSFMKDEIDSIQHRLCASSKMSEAYFKEASALYYENILIFSSESIQISDVLKAWDLSKGVDAKDTLYVALTIALDGMLWTGDLKLYRSLRRKKFMNVITTEELLHIIKGS